MECLICKSTNIKQLRFIKIISRYTKKSYILYKCESCGFIRPQDSSVKDLLSVEIYDNPKNIRFYNEKTRSIEEASEEYKYYFKHFMPYSNLVSKYNLKGSGLDIGCGAGHLIKTLSKQGLKMDGQDISPTLVSALKKQGIKVYGQDLSNLKPNKKYNLVTFNQVLEHVGSPKSFILSIKKLLKEKGYIIFAVPYLYGLVPQLLRSYWYGLGYGQHLNFFSKKSLSILLEGIGFEICEFKVLIADYAHPKFPRVLNGFIEIFMNLIVKLNLGDNLFVVARLNKK